MLIFCYRVYCDYSVFINLLDVLGTSQQGAIYAFTRFDSVNSNLIGRVPENNIDYVFFAGQEVYVTFAP